MSRKLIAALALCSVFIGGTAMADTHHAHGRRIYHPTIVHRPRGHSHSHGHDHHPTGRRSHGH